MTDRAQRRVLAERATGGKRLVAADWQVLSIPEHKEFVAFITAGHYAKGAANTSTFRHGLYRTEWGVFRGPLFGVAGWIPPTRTAAESVAGNDSGGGVGPVSVLHR